MTAYVDLAGELRAAFKSLRQRDVKRVNGAPDVRIVCFPTIASERRVDKMWQLELTERPAQERGRRAERVIRTLTLKAVFA